jgi:hypothetical protein
MSVFGVRGGPHEGVAVAELPDLVSMAGRAGARGITHDPAENVRPWGYRQRVRLRGGAGIPSTSSSGGSMSAAMR